MLYRPTFCCECGNKIERIKWMPWTSRRFCENCETEFRKEEWLPTGLLIIVTVLSGLFAFGSYLKTPEKPLSLTSGRLANRLPDKAQNTNSREALNSNIAKTVQNNVSAVNVNQNTDVQNSVSSAPVSVKTEKLQNAADSPVYFCGAQTKKGMPCGRKVKGGGRCWQHPGQPSMLPKEKLVAGR